MNNLTRVRKISSAIKKHFTNLTVDRTLEVAEDIINAEDEGMEYWSYMTKDKRIELKGTRESVVELDRLIATLVRKD